jgi:two-component system, chemotaxis family, chemotaxis protein CheY
LTPSPSRSRATTRGSIGQHSKDEDRAPDKVATRIAIVDDEDDLCSLLSMLVKRLGYLLEFVAHDGSEAVRAVSDGSTRPDVILMDYRMPKMDGIQAAKEIRRFMPETKIILATADESVRRDAVSAGLFFLQKPFSTAALVGTIDHALGGSRQLRE